VAVAQPEPAEALSLPPQRGLRAVWANPWLRFVVRRSIGVVVITAILVLAVFSSVRLIPGDPARAVLGFGATQQDYERFRHGLGLDKSFLNQLWDYTTGLLHGDLGVSFVTQQPVSQIIQDNIGPSMQLAGIALAVVMAVSIPLGLAAAGHTRGQRHRRFDLLYQSGTQILGTLPEFLFATVLAYLFAVEWQLLPVAGSQGWQSLVLPVVALAAGAAAQLSRLVRTETLSVLAQDYIRTARSKQLPTRVLFFRHVLPNVLTAVLTVGGLLIGGLIGGAVIVENVFARPGLGTQLTTAVANRDYPTIQGITLVLGLIVIFANVVVDVLIGLVDKRSLVAER
jgi:peptide/nickel transport system permease protein